MGAYRNFSRERESGVILRALAKYVNFWSTKGANEIFAIFCFTCESTTHKQGVRRDQDFSKFCTETAHDVIKFQGGNKCSNLSPCLGLTQNLEWGRRFGDVFISTVLRQKPHTL